VLPTPLPPAGVGETGAVFRVGFSYHNGRSLEIAARTGVDALLPPPSLPLPTGARAMANPDEAPPRGALVPLLPLPDSTTHVTSSVKRILVGDQCTPRSKCIPERG